MPAFSFTMPAFSFQRPRFLRFRRSRSSSPKPSLGPRDSSSGPALSTVELGVNPPEISGVSTSENLTHPQNCTLDHLLINQPLSELRGQSTCVPRLSAGQHSGQFSGQAQNQNLVMFSQAHDFTVMGTFIESNITQNSGSSSQFMKELLKETIPGAASDSSARDPPPRCHPETRLTVLKRCLDFIATCSGTKKIRWVVGSAGVGKSAIMQTVSESSLALAYRASIFFSVNGRHDGAKAIITLSYQLAAKSESYRMHIQYAIERDPSLLQSSLAVQFNKLIIEPFIHNLPLNSVGRVLIIIDGLDECNNSRTQLELLRLISDFCITYPSSPIVWLIASRPEPHITSFFSRVAVKQTYDKEEIPVDSDESRADVERFLRDELREIKETLGPPDRQWPDEQDFWKLSNASGGLFAYAHTVARYIGDSIVGNPASQLSDVLRVIDNHLMTNLSREEHPMALLDALYARILSNIPPKTMINTRKLLLALAADWDQHLSVDSDKRNFIVLCNWLGMTRDDAYAAVNHLRSVLYVPRHDEVRGERLESFHKSFIDFICDFTRSGLFSDILREARQLKTQCAARILEEAPDDMDFGDVDYRFTFGTLTRGRSTCDKISLTWSADEGVDWDDKETRLAVYELAVGEVIGGMILAEPTFQNEFYIRLLATRLQGYPIFSINPVYTLRDFAFDIPQCQELVAHGIMKQIPLSASGILNVDRQLGVKLQFRRPTTTTAHLDPWNPSCEHVRSGEWEKGKYSDWTTSFKYYCTFCYERFQLQVERWRTEFPDHAVLCLFTSMGDCCIEFRFVDRKDGVSEWTYWFWCKFTLEERQMYGSAV